MYNAHAPIGDETAQASATTIFWRDAERWSGVMNRSRWTRGNHFLVLMMTDTRAPKSAGGQKVIQRTYVAVLLRYDGVEAGGNEDASDAQLP